MKIKVAILDENVSYLNRLAAAFASRFAEKLEVYSFSNQESALTSLQNNRIDVFLSSDRFDIDYNRLPKDVDFHIWLIRPELSHLRKNLRYADSKRLR